MNLDARAVVAFEAFAVLRGIALLGVFGPPTLGLGLALALVSFEIGMFFGPTPAYCFPAGTPVLLVDGDTKPIEGKRSLALSITHNSGLLGGGRPW